MNYLTPIDEEIARLKQRIADLETAKRVLSTLKAVPAAATAEPKKKRASHRFTPNALKQARKAALEYLEKQTVPKSSREIIKAISHLKLADSTVWKALKEMRDEGVIKWDENTRFYTVVRPEQQQVAS